MSDTKVVEYNASSSWFATFLNLSYSWNRYTESMLRSIEKKILENVKTLYRGWYVDVGPVVGSGDKIWTICANQDSNETPIVLLHGLGAGVALWCLNLDALSKTRPVYAIDLLGFGRSSRPNFDKDGLNAESQMIHSIEEWRKEMNLDKFVLLGHSMGGFLAASYAIKYPGHVKHLILADPWGVPEKSKSQRKADVPIWVRAVAYTLSPFNPLWAIRVAGPFGTWIIDKVRPDISRKFISLLGDNNNLITNYLYQCNAQHPSGEAAFHAMMSGFGWAKHPIVNRIDKLHKDVPITLLYGSRSWVDNSAGEVIKEKRMDSFVNLQVITGAGHHVYADKPEIFNKHVNDACEMADNTNNKYLALMSPDSYNKESTTTVESTHL